MGPDVFAARYGGTGRVNTPSREFDLRRVPIYSAI